MSKVEIKLGTKIDKAELLNTDISKLAILTATPRSEDAVEGQYAYSAMTQCPWCGHIGMTYGLESTVYVTVICGVCGQPFQA
jgi:hypothetical protein